MNKREKRLRLLACGVILAMLCTAAAALGEAAEAAPLTAQEYREIVSTYSINDSIPTYSEYLAQCGESRPEGGFTIEGSEVSRYLDGDEECAPEILTDYEGESGAAVLTGEEGVCEWRFTAPEEGLYDVTLRYYPTAGKNSAIQRAFFLDGRLPYAELALVEFSRVWRNGTAEPVTDANGITVLGWTKDNQGNDLKPSALEIPEWMNAGLYDNNGYITDSLSLYLTAGEHTLTMVSLREPMLVRSITFRNAASPAPYAEVRAAAPQSAAKGVSIRVEAESAPKTSSQMLYPVQDQSAPTVYPASARYLLNNTIGGNSWRSAHQWIEWTVEVPEDGLYEISLYDKQNFVRGIDVYRKITVDGEVPFAELAAYPFSYRQDWRMETLQDAEGKPYEIWLTAGTHTLRMEVVLGEMADIISTVQQTVLRLNSIYRQVIYITGVSPDKYRDYQIEASLPGLKGQLQEAQAMLKTAIDRLVATAGRTSDKLTVLRTMYDQLDDLIEDQERFTEVLSSYKTNVRACGNWITQVLPQPLQIDRLYLHTADVTVRPEHDSWGEHFAHEMERLYYSFIIDYNQVGNIADSSGDSTVLTLWIGTGRDQANVIKSLIDERFTPQTGISVNVQLVDMNTLLRATLSGQGPDVAIQVANTNGIAGAVLNTGNDTPVNYGLRHAVLDLTRFSDFDEVAARFSESALVPFSFNGATYALPDTQTFPMMFYRKDILAEIGLEVPQTWDDVKVAMSVLSKNQLEFGMLPSEQIFAMLLYQAGGEYYNADATASALDDDVAINVFRRYCEFYTDYRLDKATSVEERFRTGECPLIISDYTTYNNLQVSAPDIYGLWDFTHVPGTPQADGSLCTTTGASGLADIIMSATQHPDECWTFLKWWTSTETQVLYGREMESLMGASARVATANKEALASLSWPMKDYKALSTQMAQIKGIPQVPGGYYTWRNVNNAFYAVTEDTANKALKEGSATPREELMDKVYYINAEISYKRTEFGLPTAEDLAAQEVK